jgi:hypothetical protein
MTGGTRSNQTRRNEALSEVRWSEARRRVSQSVMELRNGLRDAGRVGPAARRVGWPRIATRGIHLAVAQRRHEKEEAKDRVWGRQRGRLLEKMAV